jgi:hypothetical protein
MSTVITLNGTPLAVPRIVVPMRLVPYSQGGMESFSFAVRGGQLPASTDPYTGGTIEVTIGGVLRFHGQCGSVSEPVLTREFGWLFSYQCLGWSYLADWVRHTDSNDGSTRSTYNAAPDNLGTYNATRAGRTVGEMLLDVLSMDANATALRAVGVGQYTSSGTGARATAVINGSGVTGSTGLVAGTGYTTAPTVYLVGGSGTGATMSCTVSGGGVATLTVTAAGTGYTLLAPTIIISPLPATTIADLLAMDWIPPTGATFAGEKFVSATRSFCAAWAPTHVHRIEPSGRFRFRDKRAFTNTTLTWGSDPVQPSGLSEDVTECASHVTAFGAQLAEMFNFSYVNGGLSEAPFAHDGLTVAAAKAAWTMDDWRGSYVLGAPGDDEGSCTCPSTTTVTITSSNALQHWISNYFDQTISGHQGQLYLAYSVITGVTSYAQRGIVSNTALTAGGTCTLTVDRPLAITTYDTYTILGLTGGAAAVWTVYELPSWAAAKVAPQSYQPTPFNNPGGAGATLVSTAIGSVLWSATGSAPFSSVSVPIQVDVGTGFCHFAFPTFALAGNAQPYDVRAFVPIYTNVNVCDSPTSGNAGTYFTAKGLTRTLSLYIGGWRDPLNLANVQTWLDYERSAVENVVQEATFTYLGLLTGALEMGLSWSVADVSFTTGWEGAALPGIECELSWGVLAGEPMDHTTSVRVSNRMARYSVDQFLKPDRTGITFDFGDAQPFDGSLSESAALAAEGLSHTGGQVAAAQSSAAAAAAADPVSTAIGAGLSAGSDALAARDQAAASIPDPAAGLAELGLGGGSNGIKGGGGPSARQRRDARIDRGIPTADDDDPDRGNV